MTAIFFLAGLPDSKAQTKTWSDDTGWANFYAKFLRTIDTSQTKNSDIQIRVWFNNGANRVNTTSYLSLICKNKLWNAKYFTFTSFPHGNDSIYTHIGKTVHLNYDSLYHELLANGLLTLNSDSIHLILDKKGLHRSMWFEGGPTNYTIEIIMPQKRWALNYKCPKMFYTNTKLSNLKCH